MNYPPPTPSRAQRRANGCAGSRLQLRAQLPRHAATVKLTFHHGAAVSGGIAAGALQQVGEAFFQLVPQHGRSVAIYTRWSPPSVTRRCEYSSVCGSPESRSRSLSLISFREVWVATSNRLSCSAWRYLDSGVRALRMGPAGSLEATT